MTVLLIESECRELQMGWKEGEGPPLLTSQVNLPIRRVSRKLSSSSESLDHGLTPNDGILQPSSKWWMAIGSGQPILHSSTGTTDTSVTAKTVAHGKCSVAALLLLTRACRRKPWRPSREARLCRCSFASLAVRLATISAFPSSP